MGWSLRKRGRNRPMPVLDSITDIEAVDAFVRVIGERDSTQRGFTVIEMRQAGPTIDIHFHTRHKYPAPIYGAVLNLPSSKGLQPWVSKDPRNADDWAGMLHAWLDEETLTGCGHAGEVTIRDGIPYFSVETYGFKTTVESRHKKMRKAAKSWVPAHVRGNLPSPKA